MTLAHKKLMTVMVMKAFFAFAVRLFMETWLHVMVQIAHINGFIFSVLGSVKNLLVNGIVVIASILIDITPFAIIV